MATSSIPTTIARRATRSEPLIARSPTGNASLGAIGTVLAVALIAVSAIVGHLTRRNDIPQPSMAGGQEHHDP